MADDRFAGKVVLVIGGNSGIGLASARAFAKEGAHVIITGRNQDTLRTAAEEIVGAGFTHRVDTHSVDIGDERQTTSLFNSLAEEPGRLDVLFVNAGVLAAMPVEATTEADWDWVLGINLKGVFFTAQKALPLMRRGCSIVLCASTAAYKGIPNASLYVISKAGILALGRCLAAEWLDRGIRVNVVSPGPTETPIYDRVRGLPAERGPALRREQIETVPMRRMAAPQEVADAVLFLASDSAAFITGTELLVNGGIPVC